MLSKNLAVQKIYQSVRNPMALGHYILYLGIGLSFSSTYLTLGTLLGIMPIHILYLKVFEEKELEARYGESYIEYKKTTPFLIPRMIS